MKNHTVFLQSITVSTACQFVRLLMTLLFIGWILPLSSAIAQTPLPTISPFQAVSGVLDDDMLQTSWEFVGKRGQIISIVAERLEGDLDLVIELKNSSEQLLAANDNADRTTTNARIEGLMLPNDDTYIITVYREGLERGSTIGRFQLELLNGYSIYDINQTNAALVNQTPQPIGEINTEKFYLIAEIIMPNIENYALEWRFMDTTGIQWVFRHNVMQEWALSIETAQNEPLQTYSGKSQWLPYPSETSGLIFHRDQSTFRVLYNDQVIASAVALQPLLSTGTGSISVVANENVDTLLNNLRLTTAYYADDPKLIALPPTPSGQRIYNYKASPTQVISELRSLGYLPPPTANSGLQGDITSGFITNDEPSFNAYPLIERPFQNFVLSWTARFVYGTSSSACGLIFRQTDRDSFATVLHTPAAGLYFFEVQDGSRIVSDSIHTITPLLEQGMQIDNTFTVIALEDKGILFVNGRYADEITLNEASGIILAHLVVDNITPTYCQLDRVWLWSLE